MHEQCPALSLYGGSRETQAGEVRTRPRPEGEQGLGVHLVFSVEPSDSGNLAVSAPNCLFNRDAVSGDTPPGATRISCTVQLI